MINLSARILIIIVVLTLVFIVLGCDDSNTEVNSNNQEEVDELVENSNNDISIDAVSYEEAVLSEELEVDDRKVEMVVEVKEGITKEQVKPLLEKIGSELQEDYPDRRIEVTAVQEGKRLERIKLRP